MKQLPHARGSSLVSVQVGVPPGLQVVVATGELGQPQVPVEHVPKRAHCVVHDPQCRGSVLVLTQPAPVHIVAGAGQAHAPAVQVPPVPQLLPQAPQFAVSVLVSTHLPPQSV